jgi:DAACS family dicarboxylate/amino acid:cation (Na+ or H+) symporter
MYGIKSHHILLSALILGGLAGIAMHGQTDNLQFQMFNMHLLQPVGQIFLRLIFMIVVPMVFAALVCGVYELANSHGVGRVAGRTLMYTVVTSGISVIIGVTLVMILEPGRGSDIDLSKISTTAVDKIRSNAAASKSISQSIVEIVPRNPLDSAVRALDGEMLALMFFALVFGIALAKTNPIADNPIIKSLDLVYQTCLTLMSYVMKLAPFAVFALVFNSTFTHGIGVLLSLSYYVAIVVVALLIQNFGVYSILLKFIAKRSPIEFFQNCREVLLYAFSTASSNATLPKALETAEHKLRLPPKISRFVLTVGSTANQNGTALFEGITVLFLAQVYQVDLSLTQQIQVVVMSIIAGIGTAGVPGGSLPLIMILMQQVGVPAEGLGLVYGVDRFLDMCRTTVNVSGDLVIATLVSAGQTESSNGERV